MSLFPALLQRRTGRSALAVLVLAAPLALPPGVASADSQAFAAVRSPTDGGSVAVGTPLIIAGDATNGEGGPVESVQVDPSRDPTSIVFVPPVPVEAGLPYVASYFTAAGHYDSAELYFGGALVQPPFTTIFDEDGGAGVYQYGDSTAFPTLSWNRSNYWITPVFTDHL